MSDATLLPPRRGGGRSPVRAEAHLRRATSHRSEFVRSLLFSAARGAALIGIAVIIGIVLLQVVDEGGKGPIGAGARGKAVAGTTSTTGKASTTSTTRQGAARQPSQVQVLVLNGSTTNGAARNLTSALKAKGYQTLPAADASAKRRGTVVYFAGGFEREATAVAQAVGGNPPVQPLPDPPPPGSAGADVVVIIGS